jgi:hypothetical protein
MICSQRADSLEQQVGPDYARIVDGVGEVDPNTDEGKKYAAAFESLHKLQIAHAKEGRGALPPPH